MSSKTRITIIETEEDLKGMMVDEEGKHLATASGEKTGLSKSNGVPKKIAEKAWVDIKFLIENLQKTSKTEFKDIQRMCLALPGIGKKDSEIRDSFIDILIRENLRKITILKSIHEVLYWGSFPEGKGIFVMSGANAIILGAKINGELEIVGGDGIPLGDAGSFRRIGINVIDHVINHLDMYKEPTPFENTVMVCCSATSDPRVFKNWFREKEPTIQELYRIFQETDEWANKKDPEDYQKAREILEEQIDLLIEKVIAVIEKIKPKRNQLVLSGECFEEKYYNRYFKTRIKEKIPNSTIFDKTCDPLECGRKILFKDNFWIEKSDAWQFTIQGPEIIHVEEVKDLVLGIFGATKRWSILIGTQTSKPLLTLKGKNPLAYLSIEDESEIQEVFEKMCKRIYSKAPNYIKKIKFVKLCGSGIGDRMRRDMYRRVVKKSLKRYLDSEQHSLKIEVSADYEAVLASELFNDGSTIEKQNGIVIMSGSGSIIYLQLPYVFDRQGGYGSPFTRDPGSSYDIGYQMLEWLHRKLDVGYWGQDEKMKIPSQNERFLVERYLDAVLKHFSEQAVPGVEIDHSDINKAGLKEKRDFLRYLPLKCIPRTHLMKSVIAELNKISCEIFNPNPSDELKDMKKSAAHEIVKLFKELFERQIENIRAFMENKKIQKFPVILDGGTFRCQIYRDKVKEEIEEMGNQKNISFDVQIAEYDSSVGSYALCCEKHSGNVNMKKIRKEAKLLGLFNADNIKTCN